MIKKNNENQEMAIKHFNGPCMVLAGPGSGKTYVLTNRICNLISNNKVDANEILVITFTKASAVEMENRFLDLVNSEGVKFKGMPVFGTFHSVFFDILRNDFGYNSKSLLTDKEEKQYLIDILKGYKKINITSDFIAILLKDIRNYKLYQEREEEYIPKSIDVRRFTKIYRDYQFKLSENRKLGFSDMISECYRLLREYKNVLEYYQRQYKYILIDEFQDINKMQYDLVKLICKSKNIFVVGDDDQSIYRFRGSHPRVMSDFLKDYKKAKVIFLNKNYRCDRQIVKLSKLVIDNNKERFAKNLESNSSALGNLEIKAFIGAYDQNEYLIKLIKKYNHKGMKLSKMAILYRTNILVKSIKSDLEKNNIRYKIKDDDKNNDIVNNNLDSINLMTFHLCKGLEFDTVFLIDANDGLIPHKKSIKENDLETERRLFYVAMTRAKNNLHIFFTTHRFGKEYKPSRFILEAIGGQNGKKV